jgi:hypothetical protein
MFKIGESLIGHALDAIFRLANPLFRGLLFVQKWILFDLRFSTFDLPALPA